MKNKTNKKDSEKNIIHDENFYELILSNISDTVFLTDFHGNFVFICPNVHVIFGYNEHEIEKLGNINKLFDNRLFNAAELKKKRELAHIERTIEDKSGAAHVLLINVKVIKMQQEVVLVMCRDITAVKELEKAIVMLQEDERRRLGADIHDDLIQNLSGIQYLTHALEDNLKLKNSAFSHNAQRIAELLAKSIDQAYAVIRGLYPLELEKFGLIKALKNLCKIEREIFNVRCEMTYKTDIKKIEDRIVPKLNLEFSTHLYRIAQEALSNSVKHSKAKQIDIAISETKNYIQMTIKTKGAKMPNHLNETKSGFGMSSMKFRAGLMGASLDWKSGTNEIEIICKLSTESILRR